MDQWLKTGTIKGIKCPPENDQLENNSQNISTVLVQDTGKAVICKKRKCYDEYMKYGFSYTGGEDNPKPKCVVCGEVLSNGCMKPSMLLRHLQTKHANYKNKEYEFFKRLAAQNMNMSNLTSYIMPANKVYENAIEASYRIAYRIATCGKNHTISENLIQPCIKDAVQCMLGDKYVQKIEQIPLSNSTISRRILDMSDDVEATVIDRIKNSRIFAIQVDESTDVANFAVLLVIARYLKDNEVEENFLICHALSERTTGENIFKAIDYYFKEKGINWLNCCGLCTDGGKAMSGIYSGLHGGVLKIAPNVSWSHCCIHRQTLATKRLPVQMKLVLDEATKVVNFIKSRSTNSRIFKAFCKDLNSVHSTLLLHTEVRWLSRGKVLTRLFELRHEVQVFFEEHPFQLTSKLHDCNWLQTLAYLADIFVCINNLNLALQNDSITIFNVSDKIEAMIKKLDFWRTCLENGQLEVFENLHNFLLENKLCISEELSNNISEHLKEIKSNFGVYFHKPDEGNRWISNPFNEEYFSLAKLSIKEKENLIELSTDSTLKVEFKRKSLINFWSHISTEYQQLSVKALNVLLPFTSTILVERAFSSYLFIKNKYRNKLNAAPDLRLYLASIKPDFKKLSVSKQFQGSH